MAVSGVNSNTTNPTTTSGATQQLSETFDNFLTLLTKQLQYQDPLSPMDTNEFTSQLVQYTEVEQSISTNQKLEDLLALQGTNQAMAAMSFLGTTIEAESNQISLSQGSATFEYEMSVPTTGTTISILDDDGKLVRVIQGEKAAGSHSYTWDGKDANGVALPEGIYTLQVTGKDSDNESVDFSTRAVGKVSGVEIREGEVLLSIGALQVPLDYVHAVRPAEDVAA
jgi:flagellar basal-body rod modification protein FlgD